jgi:ribosomal protein L7/L12
VVLEIHPVFFAVRQKIGLFAAAMVTPMAAAMAAANATVTSATTAVAAALATASDSCVEGICVVDAVAGR